ncbi:hypothetical protein [Sorangium sp. So ce1097]|uniref:hypothetical protein n=1 Tax=Sorangium sp. So ce1097 TaxID=3133330 RepID=UPI003F63D608
MADQDLLRRKGPPHYPRPGLRAPDPEATPALSRQVPVRPARFPVGLDRPDKPLLPPPEQVEGTALSIAAYLGRVDEVSDLGLVTVTLWERPNGREGLTSLSVHDHLGGRTPATGDMLWIWTWIDVAEDRTEKPKIHVDIETRELDDEDRARLSALIAALTEAQG